MKVFKGQNTYLGLIRTLGIFCLILFVSGCASNSQQPSNNPEPDARPTSAEVMIAYARSLIGTEYQWGGSSPKGFDCSGYIHYVYRHFGVEVPRTTAQYESLYKNKVNLSQARKGDLIIFTGTDSRVRKPGHAGIISEVSDGELHFVHSSSSKKHFGVTETDFYDSGYPKRFLAIVRVTSL